LKDIFTESEFEELAKQQIDIIKTISRKIATIKSSSDKLLAEKEKSHSYKDSYQRAEAYCNQVIPFFEQIRTAIDGLEMMVDDEIWPLTKYRELLFTK